MKKTFPKVSIIIPVYNVQNYLAKCLDSLVNQTLNELEFICVNDGSTDNSLEILCEYAKNDSRFIIISQENQGQGCARNRALQSVQGEYIAFVDPDDWVEKDTFALLYKRIKESNADVIIFDWDYFTERKVINHCFDELYKKKLSGEIIKNGEYFTFKHLTKKKWLKNIPLIVCDKVYRAEFIKKNNIKFAPNRQGEDHIFSISSYLLAKKIMYLKKTLYHYRLRNGSAMNKASNDNFCMFQNVELVKNFLISNNLFESLYSEFAEYRITVLLCHYNCVPKQSTYLYIDKCREILPKNEFNKFIIKIKNNDSNFLERIFSIKNIKKYGKKHKIVTVLGMSFVLRNQRS